MEKGNESAQPSASNKSKSTKTSAEQKIKQAYKEYVLEHGKQPNSVFIFTKGIKLKEGVFYEHFNSFTALESAIWKDYFAQTAKALQQEKVYQDYSAREKLLAFFYTLAEVLMPERSYVLYCFEGVKKPEVTPAFLKGFRNQFEEWADGIVAQGRENGEIAERPFITDRYAQGLWLQVQFVLYYWLRDQSQAFENTDAAIEKAVNLAFDLMGRNPIDSIIDFARFIIRPQKA